MAESKRSYVMKAHWAGISVLITLYSITFLLDVFWVKHKGYAGLDPWSDFYIKGMSAYGFLFIISWLVAPVIGRIFRPRGRTRVFDFFAAWWIFATLMLILLTNEEIVPGRFGPSNPLSIIISIVLLVISFALLRFIGFRGRLIGTETETQKNGAKRPIPRLILAIVVSLVVLFSGYQITKPHIGGLPETAGDEPPNVIIITLDTLRADHVNTYAYGPRTTPHIDTFAEGSIVFENAFTPIPLTTPAHVSLFTGNLPQNHIVFQNTSMFDGKPVTKPDGTFYENTAIGTILKKNGYRTFGAVSAIHLGRQFGWGHFVDSLNEYEPPFESGTLPLRTCFQLAPFRFLAAAQRRSLNPIRKSDNVVVCFDEWVRGYQRQQGGSRPNSPFFAWLHFFDVHLPFDPPREYLAKFDPYYRGTLTGSAGDVQRYNENKGELEAEGIDIDRYVEHVNACYDAELLYMDSWFGELINGLKENGLYDNSLIIVCADHGEGFGERGFIGHNAGPFDYEMRIPFIVKPPKFNSPGQRITEPVTLCDIAPTVYDYLGIEPSIRMDGKSFKPLIDGTAADGEFDWPVPGMVFLVAHSLRWEDRQIVRFLDREKEKVVWSYFDLTTGPGAFNDLYASEGILPEEDKLTLIKWIEDHGADFQYLSLQAHEKEDVDEWTLEQLRAVGYLN